MLGGVQLANGYKLQIIANLLFWILFSMLEVGTLLDPFVHVILKSSVEFTLYIVCQCYFGKTTSKGIKWHKTKEDVRIDLLVFEEIFCEWYIVEIRIQFWKVKLKLNLKKIFFTNFQSENWWYSSQGRSQVDKLWSRTHNQRKIFL